MEVIDILKGEYDMNDKLKELLDEKIEAELNALDTFSPETEEHYRVVENVVKLYKLASDNAKAEMEDREKREQHEGQSVVEYVKLGAEIAGIILPLMFYGYWMSKGFEFEKTGSFTSTTFRNLFMRFKPVK